MFVFEKITLDNMELICCKASFCREMPYLYKNLEGKRWYCISYRLTSGGVALCVSK